MAKTVEDQTLALAGVFQATYLVDSLARRGIIDSFAFEASIHSIFMINPASTLEVYGDFDGIKTGLRQLRNHLTASNLKHLDILRYTAALLKLERKLHYNSTMLSAVQEGIARSERQIEHFSMLHTSVIANLADLYTHTISTLHPKIMVNGEQNHLSSPETANKIRSLLLAGIRSSVLWRQCGGSRWQLLFGRKKLLAQIDHMIHLS